MSNPLFDHNCDFDFDGIECRETRKVPPNPPPRAAGKDLLDGKTLARIAVYSRIDCGSWNTSAVMHAYLDFANRKNGACYPSLQTTAARVGCSEDTVRRANKWWIENGYLSIVLKGEKRSDGTKMSNVYHIHWLQLIGMVLDHHDERVQKSAFLILKKAAEPRFGDGPE